MSLLQDVQHHHVRQLVQPALWQRSSLALMHAGRGSRPRVVGCTGVCEYYPVLHQTYAIHTFDSARVITSTAIQSATTAAGLLFAATGAASRLCAAWLTQRKL